MIDVEHERQHEIVRDAKAAYDAVPKRRSGINEYDRRKVGQKAWWALTWHMRRSHGPLRTQSPFLGKTYAEIEAWHARLHEKEES